MNEYRVDLANSKRVPCGMNSIVYLGESAIDARAAFMVTPVGIDDWGQQNGHYGVVLSRWSYAEGDYIIIDSKFPVLN